MTEARRADLVYGHLGEAVYDTDSQEWHFSRVPSIGRQLKLIGQPTVAFESSLAHHGSINTQSAVTRARNIKKLTHIYPELVPGITLLPALAQTSEVICDVTSRHDPLVSELLAFGTASNRDNPRTGAKFVPIIAAAGNEAGDAVRLALLVKKIVGWHGNKTVGLKTLEVQNKEKAWWSGHGGSIQQLAFAEGDDTSWLAVRSAGAVTVLRPVLRRSMTPSASTFSPTKRGGLYASSRLDPNPIATLPKERTGGAPHADFSFNPWYGKQFALVDQDGRWSVWNVEYENKRRDLWTLDAGPAGTIHDEHNEPSDASAVNADGWGSILWAGNVHTLLVFSRRTFVLCNLQDVSERLAGPNLAPVKSGDWILDVKRSPSKSNQLFVVTSSRIFWLSIISFGEVQEKGDPNPGAQILLSWRHFRDQEDISLRINVFNDIEFNPVSLEVDSLDSKSESATLVLLYSRLTGLTTVYAFQKSPSILGLPQSISDPYALRLCNATDISNLLVTNTLPIKRKSVSTLVLKSLEYEIRPGDGPSGQGNQYMKGNVRFYQLNTLFNDLSVEQSLYASAPTGRNRPIHSPDSTLLAVPRLSAMHAKDSFIVPDGYLDELTPESTTGLNNVGIRERMVEEESASDAEDQWTVNFEWLERHLQSWATSSSSLRPTTFPIAKSFEDVLEILQFVLGDEPSFEEPGIKLLIENLDIQNVIADVEQASAQLHEIVAAAAEGNHQLKRVGLASSLIFPTMDPDSAPPESPALLQIYDSLIRLWITPLPSSIPNRVRATLERHLRHIAAELYLASYAIQASPGPSLNEDTAQESEPPEHYAFSLPVRRKLSFSKKSRSPKPSSRSSPPIHSSQLSQDTGFTHQPSGSTLPTPTPTPSLHSTRSSSSLPRASDHAAKHLRALASLAPQPQLPSIMQNILSHWDVGTNPENYDWEAIQAAAAESDVGEETEARVRKRRKIQKMAKRRRDPSNPVSSSQPAVPSIKSSQPAVPTFVSSSQLAPPVVSASQPQAARKTQGSTQFSEGIGVPATQEERGPFGARPGGKKPKGFGGTKKKKRPGF